MPEPRQGEVWLTSFHEGWERPAVVLSRNDLNKGRLILVAPCTSSRVEERRKLPNHVFIAKGEAGMPSNSVVQCHLVQPVEVELFVQRYGTLKGQKLSEVLLSLAWTTALFENITGP